MQAHLRLHASTVALQGRGVMILGPSGSGKSSLAMRLVALGALLVADDQTEIEAEDGKLIASAPLALAGLIEARGVGLLRLPHLQRVPLHLAIDLGQTETARLPPPRSISLCGVDLPLVLGGAIDHLGPAIICLLAGERLE